MAESQEVLSRWYSAAKRVEKAAAVLKNAIALVKEEGPTAEIAFDLCEKAREGVALAVRHEGIAWRKLNDARRQTSMDLEAEAPPPAQEGPGLRALPPPALPAGAGE